MGKGKNVTVVCALILGQYVSSMQFFVGSIFLSMLNTKKIIKYFIIISVSTIKYTTTHNSLFGWAI